MRRSTRLALALLAVSAATALVAPAGSTTHDGGIDAAEPASVERAARAGTQWLHSVPRSLGAVLAANSR